MLCCKECLTYTICRNTFIEHLKEWEEPYTYGELYHNYMHTINFKCTELPDTYMKNNSPLSITGFINYLIDQLSLGEINVV